MEPKGTNIPTDEPHQQQQKNEGNETISISSGKTGATTTTSSTTTEKASSDQSQSNATQQLSHASPTQLLKDSESNKVVSSSGEKCKSVIGSTAINDGNNGSDTTTVIENVSLSSSSTIIDPSAKSTRDELESCNKENEIHGNNVSSTVVTPSAPALAASNSATDNNISNNNNLSASAFAEGSERSATCSNSNTSSNCNKPPVPNFRVEGSGTGDSSVTVGVASLSTVSASISLHSSAGHCGSTGGSNSLDNGEQPGSSSGPVSIQSSEEMRLSLVSWYSEPDDPSRLIEGCCSALTTYRKEEDGTVVEDIVDRDLICASVSSTGNEGMSSVANSSNSPACKSESEEKENKTPEPSGGNSDKTRTGIIDSNNEHGSGGGSNNNGASVKSSELNISGNPSLKASNYDDSNKPQLSISKSNEGSDTHTKTQQKSGSAKVGEKHTSKHTIASSQRIKVQVPDQPPSKQCTSSAPPGSHQSKCQQQLDGHGGRSTECPRCSRRSKSGTTTPATGSQVARMRTPANRRVVQSSKSSTEIKKPIKSILKHDSRGSGSGSDKQSSMDSLGSTGDIGVTPIRGRPSNSAALMTRSDSGTRARFNFNSTERYSGSTPSRPPEDKVVSKLKRIEKYATLRVRKSPKPRPFDLSDGDTPPGSSGSGASNNSKVGGPGVPNDLMSKSMSYLEKSTNRVNTSSAQGTHHSHSFGESSSASSTLKRHGSLRAKKQTPPQWEPSGNRTSALRLQKMQEAKARNCSGTGTSSGSANSGSGDSLHFLPNNSVLGASSASTTSNSYSGSGANTLPSSAGHNSRMSSSGPKDKHMSAKVFTKLSSAMGQTASSNQKRLKQERGVQTETSLVNSVDLGRVSFSPVPNLDSSLSHENTTEQLRHLERLCNRYRNQYERVQYEFEHCESKKIELQKQLDETQFETSEMIEFLQAEKSTLAESLTEVEVEVKISINKVNPFLLVQISLLHYVRLFHFLLLDIHTGK